MTAVGGVTQFAPGIHSWKPLPQFGVSETAQIVYKLLGATTTHLVTSATGQTRIADPVASLYDLYERCSSPNWDGEGAELLSYDAVAEAEQLIYLLPSAIPIPEFVPEPTGAVALEWYQGRDRVYILSVDGTRSIQFAALMGRGNEFHGRVNFEASLPIMVLDHLKVFFRG